LGDVRFGDPTGPFYREKIEFAFFSHYLKGNRLSIEKVNTFETGVNQWKNYKTWPPKEAGKNLYLLPNGKLSFTAPSAVKNITRSLYPTHGTRYRLSMVLIWI
jgi:predicted acyl esterase